MLSVERPSDPLAAVARRTALGPGGAYVGGGTALQLAWGGDTPALTLLDVGALPQATGIARHGHWLRIGAAVPLEAVRRDPDVRAGAPLLAAACDQVAALSVRHLATLGGNLAWRFGDALAPLLALDARIEGADGQQVPLEAALAAPVCPLLLAVWIDTTLATSPQVYEKVGRRAAFSPTRLAFAAVRGPDGLRLAAGGAQLPTRRLRAAERAATHAPDTLPRACLADLDDPVRARLVLRLILGHGPCAPTSC